ncbi:MAG: AtpZ/AtpI family protein [Dethiobacteria bacterium]|jgi:ATP synthase protein I
MNKKDKKNHWMIYVRHIDFALSFGITMILTTLLGIFGGKWIDQQLGTGPIFLLLGIILGIGAGFYSLWSELINLQQEESRKKMPTPGKNKERVIVREDDNKQK